MAASNATTPVKVVLVACPDDVRPKELGGADLRSLRRVREGLVCDRIRIRPEDCLQRHKEHRQTVCLT